MSNSRTYSVLTFALPIGVFLLAAGLVALQWVRLRSIEEENKQVAQNVAFLDSTIAMYQKWKSDVPKPAIPDSEAEQTDFLADLRDKAALAQVQIVKFANVMRPATAAAQPMDPANPDKNKANSALAGITARASTVEVAGEYQKVREFMYAVLKSTRLLNVSNLLWARTEDANAGQLTRLSFNITRYVTPPQTTPPNQPVAAGTTNPSEVSK